MDIAGRALHRGAMAIVAAVAAALVWSVGFQGFMPLDQSIVWDGAWRLLQGQQPFADFLAPVGLVPIAIQAVLFRLFGVSWTVYVGQAALANAVLAVAVYAVLARLFDRVGPALVYGLLTGLALYPPMGTPYPDQHAVLFGVLAVLLVLRDLARPRPSPLAWFLLPGIAALALLSKPIPGLGFVIGAMLLLLVDGGLRHRIGWEPLFAMLLAIAALAMGALAWFYATGVAPGDAVLSLWTLPGGIGAERLTWDFVGPRLGSALKPGLVLVLMILLLPWRDPSRAGRVAWSWQMAGLILTLTALVYALLSDNSSWFGIGGLPLAAGLAHLVIERRVRAWRGAGARAGWVVAAAMAVQFAVLHVDTSMTRAANELRQARWAQARDAATIDPRLAGLRWALPPMVARDLQGEDRPDAWRLLLDTLRGREGGFVLIGDATIIYALADRPSPMSALWFHPGLAYPSAGDPARPGFDAMLARNLARQDVRYAVVDGDRTWTGARATDFAPLAVCLEKAAPPEAIGRFRIFALPRDCIQR